MNRLTLNLSDIPAVKLDTVSSFSIQLPSDVSTMAAARISAALNGRLNPGAAGCMHEIVIQIPSWDNPLYDRAEST